MRSSVCEGHQKKAAAARERILDEAAKLVCERGFNGIGVADLIKSVGLTHGGFYGHFGSKEDLMAQACHRAVSTMLEQGDRVAATATASPLAAITIPYLSNRHRMPHGGPWSGVPRRSAAAYLGSDESLSK